MLKYRKNWKKVNLDDGLHFKVNNRTIYTIKDKLNSVYIAIDEEYNEVLFIIIKNQKVVLKEFSGLTLKYGKNKDNINTLTLVEKGIEYNKNEKISEKYINFIQKCILVYGQT